MQGTEARREAVSSKRKPGIRCKRPVSPRVLKKGIRSGIDRDMLLIKQVLTVKRRLFTDEGAGSRQGTVQEIFFIGRIIYPTMRRYHNRVSNHDRQYSRYPTMIDNIADTQL